MSPEDFVATQLDPSFSWKDAEKLVKEWDGPAFLKGVVHPDDALRARDAGFSGVTVSNHGGRQLDSDIATIRALPSISKAVGDDMEIILDGGVRRGTDVLIAIALGANAVSIGRPYLYGLAAGGEKGVARALSLLEIELKRAMALIGVSRLSDISADILVRP